MRKRIKTQEKINITLIGGQIKEAHERKREVIREVLRDICNRDNVRIGEAKVILRKELKWACVKREVQAYCNEAKRVQAN